VRVAKQWDGTAIPLTALVAVLSTPTLEGVATNGHASGTTLDDDRTARDALAGQDPVEDDGNTTARGDAEISVETIVNVLPQELRERITDPATGDRSRDLYYVVSGLISRGLDNATIERIIRHYPQGIGAKYVGRTNLDSEISRIRQKTSRRDTAQADAAKTRGSGRPVVQVWDGALPVIVDNAELLLIARDLGIYEFGDQIVRPAIEQIRIADDRFVPRLRLIPIGLNHMIERFTHFIDFQRYDARSEEFVSIDCPKKVAATYLERVGAWRLRKLVAITTCPVLRRDGTVLNKPGFDPLTNILFDPRGIDYPPIPAEPTRDDALAALAELQLLFYEFPFVDDPSRSVALSAMLTSISRLALKTAPMHAFDAPAAGTGKSKIIDCCAVLATGHECAVISQGTDETEMGKRLGAALIAGDRMISIDNCEHPLGGQLVCQVLTQLLVKVRVLGLSKMVTVPNAANYFATGNNLTFIGDMTRRGLQGRLDAGVERPELREFTTEDPVETVKRERPKYVAACLTILRAYIVAGAPQQTRPLGGFEDWSRLVCDALVWLGEADPVDTMERARAEDPQREALAAILARWGALLGSARVSVKDVIDRATDFERSQSSSDLNRKSFLHPEFREALLTVAGNSGKINGRRLGKWLSANKGKIVNGLRIVGDGTLEGIARYRLQCLRDEKWE
jgi:putative DNA primase/helicase